jgi:hypothetical protein
MLRSTRRRLAAVTAVAAVLVTALVMISSATATPERPHVVYRYFCPVNSAQVPAAGAYTPSR